MIIFVIFVLVYLNSRGEKSENSFRSLLQEDLSSNSGSFQPQSVPAATSQEHWRQKIYSGGGGGASSEDSSVHDFKRGFSLDQSSQFSSQASSNDSTITSQNFTAGFQAADSSTAYGLLLPENQHSAYQNRPMSYPYPSSGYAANPAEFVPPSMNKYPPFLRTSSPPPASSSYLHFTNNTPFWNASIPVAPATDARSSFFPSPSQTQIPAAPSFDEKPKVSMGAWS